VCEETTGLTSPLRPEGYVDYAAALDQRCRSDIRPEENAAVLCFEAVGSSAVPESIRAEYFARLGMPVPAGSEGRLVLLEEFEEHPEGAEEEPERYLDEEIEIAWGRPWSRTEFPRLARALVANEGPLRRTEEASRRRRWYVPTLPFPEDSSMIDIESQPYPLVDLGEVVWLLCARASLHVQEDRARAAMEDLLTCHRLARLVAQPEGMLDLLIGYSWEERALQGDLVLAHHGELTRDQLRRYRDRLHELEPFPDVVEVIDVAERWRLLDWVQAWERHPSTFPRVQYFPAPRGFGPALADLLLRPLFDWDGVLRETNACVDRLVAAARIPGVRERTRAVKAVGAELVLVLDEIRGDEQKQERAFWSQAYRSQVFARLFCGLSLPSTGRVVTTTDELTTHRELTLTALRLAEYRADRGRYPESLQELVGAYVDRAPPDPFGEGPFHYRRDGEGFVLWSVGPDGEDEAAEREEGWDTDDLVLQVPVPEEEW
jgi:hypothetical protein